MTEPALNRNTLTVKTFPIKSMHLPDLKLPESLWKSTASKRSDIPQLPGDIETDLLIIGAGYTGLSTALHAGSQAGKITIIDQSEPGWGCSGRNGGQINPQWKSSIAHLRKQYSANDFDNFIALISQSSRLVFNLIDRYEIDCVCIRAGAFIPARGKQFTQYLRDWYEFWRMYGFDVKLLDRHQVEESIGTSVYESALSVSAGGSLNPLSYTRGLYDACVRENIDVFGNTKAISIKKDNKLWNVSTPKGNIMAKKVVIGTNGYTDSLWPGLEQALVPVASMISATVPLPESIAHSILPNRQPVAEYAGVPYYYRIDENNRLVFGGRGTRSGGIGKLNTSHLHSAAGKLFPAIKDLEWQYNWAGFVGITHHQRPLLLQLDKDLYAGLGYNGRGITMATAMGQQLANAIAGEPTLLPIEPLYKIPMHRFNRFGVTARIARGELTDRREGLR